jgi:hypothetical protein
MIAFRQREMDIEAQKSINDLPEIKLLDPRRAKRAVSSKLQSKMHVQ